MLPEIDCSRRDGRGKNNILQSRINRAQKCGGEAIGRAGAATLGGYELRSNFSV